MISVNKYPTQKVRNIVYGRLISLLVPIKGLSTSEPSTIAYLEVESISLLFEQD